MTSGGSVDCNAHCCQACQALVMAWVYKLGRGTVALALLSSPSPSPFRSETRRPKASRPYIVSMVQRPGRPRSCECTSRKGGEASAAQSRRGGLRGCWMPTFASKRRGSQDKRPREDWELRMRKRTAMGGPLASYGIEGMPISILAILRWHSTEEPRTNNMPLRSGGAGNW
jgi:hypothetical protein